jgi:cardiolipin synthase
MRPYYDAASVLEQPVADRVERTPALGAVIESIARADLAVPLTARTAEIQTSGAEHFESLKRDLAAASEFVHLSYFIWGADELTAELSEILLDRLAAGVEVRCQFDWLGSLQFSKRELHRLRDSGARVAADVMQLTRLNTRNHRKIVVIDGEIGYTGGMNLAQEYIDGGAKYPSWRDTMVRITGPAVAELQKWFAARWYADTHEDLFEERYFPSLAADPGTIIVQTVGSGPDDMWGSARRAHMLAIAGARERLLLQSPYFVPDGGVLDVLTNAALGGTDVHFMMTGWPDKRIAFRAAQSYWRHAIESGMHIYLYMGGFFHAKTVVVDSHACAIGTMNLDVRSLHLSQELMVWIYDEDVALAQERAFEADLEHCTEVTLAELDTFGYGRRLLNSAARLASDAL